MISNDNLYKTLKSSYDPDACAEAMKEWLEDQAAANEALLNDIADIATDDTLVVQDNAEWWSALLQSRGYSANLPIQLVDGYYTMGSFVRSAYFSGAGAIIGDDGEVTIPTLQPIFPDDDPTTGLARMRDVGTDAILTGSKFNAETVDEVFSNIKSNLHSVVAMAGAVASSKFESVPERLTYFRDYVTRKFSNAFSDISNMASSMTDLLESVKGPSDLLQSLNDYTGISGLADDNEYVPVSNSDAYKFTGANPAGALDFSVAKSALKSTVRLAAKVVKGIFNAAISGIKRLFHKIKSKFNEVTVNPVDIAIRDNNAECYCVDGLHCPSAAVEADSILGVLPQSVTDADLDGVSFPKDFVIESWFGHLLISNLEVSRVSENLMGDCIARGKATSAWTPYFINVQNVIDEVFNPTFDEGEQLWNNGVSFMNRLEQFAMNGELYLSPSSESAANNERLLLGGLLASTVLGYFLLRPDLDKDSSSLTWPIFQGLRTQLLKCDPRSATCDLPLEVTNEDFFAAATGINKGDDSHPKNEFVLQSGKVYYRSKNENLAWKAFWNYPSYYDGGVPFIVYNRLQKKFYPSTYPFCPYNTKRTNSPSGKFYIKTDAQNRENFNKFATAAVIAAVVAVVTVVVGVTLKVKANKAKLKLAGAQRNYENVIGNPTSTPQQIKDAKKAYKKAKLQNRLLNSASAGLQSTPSQAASTAASEANDVDSNFLQIKSLIIGSL